MTKGDEKPQPVTVTEIYEAALRLSAAEREELSAMLEEAALKLSAEERELLVVMLEQHDAPRWASPEIEAAWMEEIERRERLFREGQMEAYAWEEVRERILKRLAEPR